MACCGQRRALVAGSGAAAATPQGPRPVSTLALYEYTGGSGMTVHGPLSGATYRFAAPGVKVAVDPRDVASLAGLPHLRRIG